MNEPQFQFALDIGTRSVVGIISKSGLEKTEILEIFPIEHEDRAMLDGQIHDVTAVANVIKNVKSKLEQKYGELSKVSVAAAGRALRTIRGKSMIELSPNKNITDEDIYHLELSAVQDAQNTLARKFNDEQTRYYYCVGYSVVHCYLNDEIIGNLNGHKGESASVEVIATFLPNIVVESLMSALERSDLVMDALTLEPIAAINVLIPPTMRRLNVALVDIGAGTSDIAITNEGTITGYGMVPIAGDEITEALCDEFLLDFPIAEKIKRLLSTSESVTINDILGFEQLFPTEEVINKIEYSINRLAKAISEEILKLNQKAPMAVMLIGGGSLTPLLCKKISQNLEIPENRVAVRGIDAIQNIHIKCDFTVGPEFVTPIGIALTAKINPIQYVSVNVNGDNVRLFDAKSLTVGDALLTAGTKIKNIYGKPGIAKIITINGQTITIPGTHGQAPEIKVNGERATLSTVVQNGDKIIINKGTDGVQVDVSVGELLDAMHSKTITLNGKSQIVGTKIFINNVEVSPDTIVKDHDVIVTTEINTINDLIKDLGSILLTNITVKIDDKAHSFPVSNMNITKNGVKVSPSERFYENDDISFAKSNFTLSNLCEAASWILNNKIKVKFNGNDLILVNEKLTFERNGTILKENDVIYNNDILKLLKKDSADFIFQDVFRYVDIEPPKQLHKTKFITKINGSPAGFHDIIKDGDVLEMNWEKENY
ncbi:MAG: cell division FtsA family protein [Bacillales bacterium]|jgi:cell division protein FtsA|nr:cell division FtsA family protein [Bacillales bacterium]